MDDKTKRLWQRANRVLEIATAMAERSSLGWQLTGRIEEIQLHSEYAEPGYGSAVGIIATGNWNTITKWNDETKEHDLISDLPKRVGDIFEKMGIECEWSDEWSECHGCNKLIRTSADSYSWQPSYWVTDSEILCVECVKEDPDAYLEAHEGDADTCISIEDIDPADHGYVKVNEDSYESGWHPGQTDDPQKVAAELTAKGVKRYLFRKDENSQFYSKWSVYVHEDEAALIVEAETAEAK